MLYLVCHENGGYITDGVLFGNHADAVAEIRRRRENELAERKSNDPTDGYWIEEDSCYAHPSGWGYVSITNIPDEKIHGDGEFLYGNGDVKTFYYPMSFDDGGCVDDVELWTLAADAHDDLMSRVRNWNQAETDTDILMHQVDGNDNHYDDGNGFGFILGDKLEVK